MWTQILISEARTLQRNALRDDLETDPAPDAALLHMREPSLTQVATNKA